MNRTGARYEKYSGGPVNQEVPTKYLNHITSEIWMVPILVRGHFGVSGYSNWFLEVAKDLP